MNRDVGGKKKRGISLQLAAKGSFRTKQKKNAPTHHATANVKKKEKDLSEQGRGDRSYCPGHKPSKKGSEK